MLRFATRNPGFEATPLVTPFLTAVPANGEKTIRLHDSTKILEFLSDQVTGTQSRPNLYTTDPATKEKILALEDRIDIAIGTHVRRCLYYEILLKSPRSVARSLGGNGNVGKLQGWLWKLMLPLISLILRRHLKMSEESAAKSKEIIRGEFKYLSGLLESNPSANGGPAYLIGNQFTAADLAMASLGGVMVGVNHEHGYGAWLPAVTDLPPDAQAFAEELLQTTAGKHALDCYRLYRGSKAPGSSYGSALFGLW